MARYTAIDANDVKINLYGLSRHVRRKACTAVSKATTRRAAAAFLEFKVTQKSTRLWHLPHFTRQ
jgi:hypothetical protein